MSGNTVKPGVTGKGQRRTRARRGRRVVVLLLRFVSGRPLDGRRHSNGTFWRRGTRRIGYPPYLLTWAWWALAAGWQRAVIRLTATAVVGLLAWAVLA